MNNKLKYYFFILFITTIQSANVVAAIASLKGDVKIRQMESAKYVSAYKGQMIESGNWIKTGNDVFLAVIFLDGTNVKIHQKTEIEIKSSRLTSKELKTNMYIAEGEAWSDVNKQGNGSFKIETPTAVASVKGTEFDVVYDFNSGSTMLKVISGEVEFGNDDIGNILANAMEGSEINKDTKEPSKYKITEEDIPKWQNNIQSDWGFNIIPDKEGQLPINTPLRTTVQIKNLTDDTSANDFTEIATVESESQYIYLSNSNTTWQNKIDLNINDGKSTFYIKSVEEGAGAIVMSAKNAESQKLNFNFYQTKSQKKDNQNKIFQLATNKGYTNIVSAIQDMNLESSKIIFGSTNIDDIIQKIESNEYEIVKFDFEKNNDKIIVILEIKPKLTND